MTLAIAVALSLSLAVPVAPAFAFALTLVLAFTPQSRSPLGLAVRSNAVEAVKVLLAARADVNAVAGNGKTALEIAAVNGKQGLVGLLKQVELV